MRGVCKWSSKYCGESGQDQEITDPLRGCVPVEGFAGASVELLGDAFQVLQHLFISDVSAQTMMNVASFDRK